MDTVAPPPNPTSSPTSNLPQPSGGVKKWWIVFPIIIVLIVVGSFAWVKFKPTTPTTVPTISPTITPFPTIPAITTITITEAGFNPEEATISAGEVVTWQNQSRTKHEIAFESKAAPITVTLPLSPGAKASLAFSVPSVFFTKPDTYVYFDKLNPKLRGEITVK